MALSGVPAGRVKAVLRVETLADIQGELMQGWEIDAGAVFVVLFLFFGLPVIILVGRALLRGIEKGVSFWRVLGAGVLIAAATIGAFVAWFWLWADGPIADAYGIESINWWADLIFWGILLLIPVGGVVGGVWALGRMGQAGRDQST